MPKLVCSLITLPSVLYITVGLFASATLVLLYANRTRYHTLKRQATEILNQLEKDREPILITQHGVPSAYLVDVETFETLQRRMTIAGRHCPWRKAIEEVLPANSSRSSIATSPFPQSPST